MGYVFPDTNTLIEDPYILKKLLRNNINIVIPVTVIQELDKFKNDNELGYKVRCALKEIEKIKTKTNKLIITNKIEKDLHLNVKKGDDKILGAILYYQKKGYDVALLSNDRAFRLVAESYNIPVYSNADIISSGYSKTSINKDTKRTSSGMKVFFYVILAVLILFLGNIFFEVDGFIKSLTAPVNSKKTQKENLSLEERFYRNLQASYEKALKENKPANYYEIKKEWNKERIEKYLEKYNNQENVVIFKDTILTMDPKISAIHEVKGKKYILNAVNTLFAVIPENSEDKNKIISIKQNIIDEIEKYYSKNFVTFPLKGYSSLENEISSIIKNKFNIFTKVEFITVLYKLAN